MTLSLVSHPAFGIVGGWFAGMIGSATYNATSRRFDGLELGVGVEHLLQLGCSLPPEA